LEDAVAAIDVLMPVRNGMLFLAEAIDSIRNQTFSDWRLLVLDHGSVDGSLELAKQRAQTDRRILVSSHPEANGIAALRNIGLAKCDCRYLLLQDADDVSFANRMDVVVQSFETSPGMLAIGGEAVVIDNTGRRIGHLRAPAAPAGIAAASFFYFPVIHPTAAADFRALMRLGAAYGEDIMGAVPPSDAIQVGRLAEDYILFGQLALLGPCANVPLPLIRYRRHKKSVGISSPMEQIGQALRISRFLAKSFCLRNGLETFDPAPFCNDADYVFDFSARDYSDQFRQMASIMRRGLGPSDELERELAFRQVLATRDSGTMALRFMHLLLGNATSLAERRTVRNWLLRDLRRGRYIYREAEATSAEPRAAA
jgi:glycosyltransferase involved in cell wall biosynthesis